MVRVKHDDARRAKMFAGVRHDTDDETRNNMLSTARVRMGHQDTAARAVVAKLDLLRIPLPIPVEMPSVRSNANPKTSRHRSARGLTCSNAATQRTQRGPG